MGFTRSAATRRHFAARFWAALRQWSGDDAYERYLLHHRLAHPDLLPLDRRAFHRHYQQQRFSGVSRCC